MIWDIFGAIIGGFILGVLARFILPGKQNISMLVTIIAGIVAALVGTLIARIFGFADTKGFDWWEHILQLVLALVAISYAAKRFPKNRHSGGTGTPHPMPPPPASPTSM
jgi:uncharacterized membrane protein YeaQ/YmgE (transglycosylase-associated protein family)